MNRHTNKTHCNTVSSLLVIVMLALPAFAQNGKVLVLNPPGSIYTTASGVNSSGITVGAFEFSGQPLQGFAYLPANREYRPIQYPGATYTIALSVNDINTVVGTFANSDGIAHGFLLDHGKYLQYDVGSSGTVIQGINKAGDFSGTSGSNGDYQGFVSIGGVVTTFTVNGLVTNAYAINSSGDTVGFFINQSATAFHGFVRDGSGKTKQIDYPGSLSTACTGINDKGVITGFYEDANNNDHGFILINGKFKTLAAPYIAGINNRGAIVGSFTGNNGQTYGFLRLP